MSSIKSKLAFASMAIVATVAVCFATMTIVPQYVAPTPPAPVVETVNIYEGLIILAQDEEASPVGGEASIVVSSQSKGVVGELIRFDVSSSVAESFKWLLVPEAADFEVYANGTRAVFSAREAGDYMFVVACAYKGTVDVTTHIVTIKGDPLVDPVDPVNPVDPVDWPIVIDPGAGANLRQKLPYWCAQAGRPQEEAQQLAGSFESVAAMISAGIYTTPEEIILATGQANRQALGSMVQNWIPVLRQLQDEFQQMSQDGKLVTLEQHAETWRLVATSLRAYASLFPVKD